VAPTADDYAIVSPADLKRAAEQIAAGSGTVLGTLGQVKVINRKRKLRAAQG
jgi:hypothetical protein